MVPDAEPKLNVSVQVQRVENGFIATIGGGWYVGRGSSAADATKVVMDAFLRDLNGLF